MKKKRRKKFLISGLSLILLSLVSLGLSSYAQEDRRLRLIGGLDNISRQTLLLKQSNIKRLHILEKDLAEFEEKGSKGVGNGNILYLTNKTGFSGEELDRALAGTDLYGLGEDFAQAEDKYSVNAIFLMSMAKLESGNGTSYLAKEKNNLFGFNAIDSDPINGAKTFRSQGESIAYVAQFLSENYLNEDGRFYNGISTDGVGKDYASDPDWASKVQANMIEISKALLR